MSDKEEDARRFQPFEADDRSAQINSDQFIQGACEFDRLLLQQDGGTVITAATIGGLKPAG